MRFDSVRDSGNDRIVGRLLLKDKICEGFEIDRRKVELGLRLSEPFSSFSTDEPGPASLISFLRFTPQRDCDFSEGLCACFFGEGRPSVEGRPSAVLGFVVIFFGS